MIEPRESNARTPAEMTLDVLAKVIREQDTKYGPFTTDIGGLRLAVACLEDEVAEVRQSWRDERRVDTWQETAEEALQVAAVAMRLVYAITGVKESV